MFFFRITKFLYRRWVWVVACSFFALSFSSPFFFLLFVESQRSCSAHIVSFARNAICGIPWQMFGWN